MVGVDQSDLGRLVVVDIDGEVRAGLGLADPDVEAGIVLAIDQDVVRSRRAGNVAPDLDRAVVVVEADIEHRLAVAGPDDAAARVGHLVGEVAAGGEVADADGERLRALVVDGVGEQSMVMAVGDGAELPVGLVRGFLVAVEQHGLGAAGARLPAYERVLAAGDVAHVVGPGAVRGGDGAVVLLDPPLHLREQGVLQVGGVREPGLGMGVLRLEVGADRRVEHGGIAHHLLPVGGAQPGVVVGNRDAVPEAVGGLLGGTGWRGGYMELHDLWPRTTDD